ncbi:MAG: enoyl-CoA hydratase-related protein [Alphaproteobacteria bacterium]
MATEAAGLQFVEGRVAEVVLANPGRLNAMDPAFFARLTEIFAAVAASDTVRVVLLRAEGRAFSIGLDKELSRNLLPPASPGEPPARRTALLHATIRRFQAAMMAVRECPRPVIAAVNGFCLGGGLDLACAADIRVCAADAQFAVHETRIAMVADLGTLTWLPRLVGRGMAREMAFTGAPVGGERALAAGLVNAVFPDREALVAGARRLAEDIARNAPATVGAVKRLMDEDELADEARGLRRVALWNAGHFFSADLEEAHRAGIERREPRWSEG